MVWVISKGPNTICPNRIVYIYTRYIKIWGTSGFCTWSYFIYYVHNPSWEHYSETWVELSSLRGRYSVVYFLPTRCISIKGDSNILSWSLYQGHKDMDDQQPFETEWWQTELTVITTHSNTSQNQHIGINIGDSLIAPSSEPPRNLGVLFDSTCSLNDHVSKICKSINYNLYSIGKIRKYLHTPTAEKMINCSITSRLDYCNSLLYGAKGYNISQLQLCQSNAAWMLSLRRKFDHITPVLKDQHWLPVEQRIEYKVLLLTYKALHGKAPAYISQLLSLYTPTRPLRSENKNIPRVPRCRLEGFGRRCFAYAAPSLWNPLPTPVKRASSIDTFKSSLKTYLFNVAYTSIHWNLYCMSILFVTNFKCFLLTSAFEHGDFSPFFKLALYKFNIIIISSSSGSIL